MEGRAVAPVWQQTIAWGMGMGRGARRGEPLWSSWKIGKRRTEGFKGFKIWMLTFKFKSSIILQPIK